LASPSPRNIANATLVKNKTILPKKITLPYEIAIPNDSWAPIKINKSFVKVTKMIEKIIEITIVRIIECIATLSAPALSFAPILRDIQLFSLL
jgi:hypothetical protein